MKVASSSGDLTVTRDPALRLNRECLEERYGMFRKSG